MTNLGVQMQKEIVLVRECIKGDRKSQHELYNLYAGKAYAICMRYASNPHDAQDMLQEGFIKVFTKIGTFRWDGSLEGWIKRIFIHTCIEVIRKKNRKLTFEIDHIEVPDKELNGFEKIGMKELLSLIQGLPDGYRAVVNLFLVEGFSHKEISELVGIAESTSKSQWAKAKVLLQKQISILNN